LVFALIFLTILIAIIFGVAKLTQVTPRLTARVQQLAARAASGTQHVADGAVKPFIWLQQAGAVIKSLLKPRS
jgi:hypothetical protein